MSGPTLGGDDWRVSTLAKSFLLDTHFPIRTITFLDKKMIGSQMIQHTVIDKDPELVTSLRYLTQCPRNPMHIITMDVCTRLGVLVPGEVYHPDQMKTKTIFVVGQLIYALLWLLPTPIFFHLRFINTTFLLVLVVAGIWRGGSYYIFVFSKIYNKKFESDKTAVEVEKRE